MGRFIVFRPCIAVVLILLGALSSAHAEKVLVAVASNFKETNDALAAEFQKKTGVIVESAAGSTGKLFTQIQNGAPFHLFLAADNLHPRRLEEAGQAVSGTHFTYAIGKLALYSESLPVQNAAALKLPQLKHLAIANPDAAPYGSAAVAYLKGCKAWEGLVARIVYGENIAQTAQFVQSGAAEAGFVAYSQVKDLPSDKVWLLPTDQYPVIRQDAVLLSTAKDNASARAYLAFLKSPEAQATIVRSGYGDLNFPPPAPL